ncbi:hypothetical protein X798_06912 [Onchocerca flexuosa]|uniref:Uncharacterized protein n=1 Tax=Onchocerca flexuosa TaxID=387005 RepID=A0A238BN91_9BILA|nr:hypothetical protein X798_06912 [Onchocerca flexuosa]
MDQQTILGDRMIHRLMIDQFLDGFSDYRLIAVIDAGRILLRGKRDDLSIVVRKYYIIDNEYNDSEL